MLFYDLGPKRKEMDGVCHSCFLYWNHRISLLKALRCMGKCGKSQRLQIFQKLTYFIQYVFSLTQVSITIILTFLTMAAAIATMFNFEQGLKEKLDGNNAARGEQIAFEVRNDRR